jgi:hypothetical protein
MRLLIATMLCLLPLTAQDAPPQGGQKKGGGGPPKNLKILTAEEVRPAMGAFRVALGVQCSYCHVQGDFASDENPKKNVARMMLGLVHDVNAKFPGEAKQRVTCYTCHRGAAEPLTAPPAAQ